MHEVDWMVTIMKVLLDDFRDRGNSRSPVGAAISTRLHGAVVRRHQLCEVVAIQEELAILAGVSWMHCFIFSDSGIGMRCFWG